MPHKQPTELSSGSLYFGSINRQQYRAYGQTIGDAILFIGPQNYAAAGRKKYFTDSNSRYNSSKGGAFTFEPLPLSSSWEGKYSNKTYPLDRYHHYELQRNTSTRKDREALYVACEPNTKPPNKSVKVHLDPWMGEAQGNAPLFAIFKHWQRHAYRFS
ncbi:hypothetical protein [Anaerotardibacter muris]|uniref:hypothetical protein n=1 Tax=Anaerotardibacter muris TaxID=2941505 RepID=UPI002042060F|nr:hypothetical protein [Anaerotardibacter muris]